MHLVCSECLGVNRIEGSRVLDQPKCGKCRHLLIEEGPLEVSEALFNKLLARSDLPLVVDFWAPWCGPCKSMGPIFSKAAKAMKGRAIFVKVNTESEQQLAGVYGIRSIPTLKVFKNTKVSADMAGALPESQLMIWLQQHV